MLNNYEVVVFDTHALCGSLCDMNTYFQNIIVEIFSMGIHPAHLFAVIFQHAQNFIHKFIYIFIWVFFKSLNAFFLNVRGFEKRGYFGPHLNSEILIYSVITGNQLSFTACFMFIAALVHFL